MVTDYMVTERWLQRDSGAEERLNREAWASRDAQAKASLLPGAVLCLLLLVGLFALSRLSKGVQGALPAFRLTH